jgi:hypothetical protein
MPAAVAIELPLPRHVDFGSVVGRIFCHAFADVVMHLIER